MTNQDAVSKLREALEKIVDSCRFESGYTKVTTIRILAEVALATSAAPETPTKEAPDGGLELAARYVEGIKHDVFSLQNIANGIRNLAPTKEQVGPEPREWPACHRCEDKWERNPATMMHRHPMGTQFNYPCTAAAAPSEPQPQEKK